MLDVLIPDNAVPERTYILEIMFREILGLNFHIRAEKVTQYHIVTENKRTLIIDDAFFLYYDHHYLRAECLPQRVVRFKTTYASEEDILVLYGRDELVEHQDKIVCAADIFAASFYMLTRWEEVVIQQRDEHERFPAEQSLAFRYGFLNR